MRKTKGERERKRSKICFIGLLKIHTFFRTKMNSNRFWLEIYPKQDLKRRRVSILLSSSCESKFTFFEIHIFINFVNFAHTPKRLFLSIGCPFHQVTICAHTTHNAYEIKVKKSQTREQQKNIIENCVFGWRFFHYLVAHWHFSS